jgi:hypothetical protein
MNYISTQFFLVFWQTTILLKSPFTEELFWDKRILIADCWRWYKVQHPLVYFMRQPPHAAIFVLSSTVAMIKRKRPLDMSGVYNTVLYTSLDCVLVVQPKPLSQRLVRSASLILSRLDYVGYVKNREDHDRPLCGLSQCIFMHWVLPDCHWCEEKCGLQQTHAWAWMSQPLFSTIAFAYTCPAEKQ